MAAEAPLQRPPEEGAAIGEACRHGVELAARLLDIIDPVHGGFQLPGPRLAHPAAHQLLWQHHMASGAPEYGSAVVGSLRAMCRSPIVDHVHGGVYRACSDARREKTLGDNAQLLELLTWVWRVCRCPELRGCAEGIVGWVVAETRVPGVGFTAGLRTRDGAVLDGADGLMLVALVEAGSVFERREWLALAREVFDEIVTGLHAEGASAQAIAQRDGYAMMIRAAIRLFEAFGKRRYLEIAETWVATLDADVCDETGGGYRTNACARPLLDDGALPSANALMIGVHTRLHALTGAQGYADRAARLIAALHGDIEQSGIADATAIASAWTAARFVSIVVSGDPRLPETRALMRIALDCGLPDRLVLGPGAGGTPGEKPCVRIRIGTDCLAPIDEPTPLRAVLAPGGLGVASLSRNG